MTYTPSKFPPASALIATATITAWPGIGSLFALTSGAGGGLGSFASNQFTVSKSGHYILTVVGVVAPVNGNMTLRFRKNTATLLDLSWNTQVATASHAPSGFVEVDLTAGDVVDIIQTTPSSITPSISSGQFAVRFIPTLAFPQ